MENDEKQRFENLSDWLKIITKMMEEGFEPVAVVGVDASDGRSFQVIAHPCVDDVQSLLSAAAVAVHHEAIEQFDADEDIVSH